MILHLTLIITTGDRDTQHKQDMVETPPIIDNITDSQGLIKNKPPLH